MKHYEYIAIGLAWGIALSALTVHVVNSKTAEDETIIVDSTQSLPENVVHIVEDATWEELESRPLYTTTVEVVHGTVTSEDGDGETVNGSYIYYGHIDNIEVGDHVTTYCVYNPETQYADDIIARTDYVQER